MSTSVNVPVNPKQRDADIEKKLRLYGIYNAFSNGKLPSNKQIDVALTSLINHKKLKSPNNNLSSEGKVILEDFRNVVEEAKRLVLTKNHDEALQEFIWNATQLGQKGGPDTTGAPTLPVGKDTAKSDQQKGMEGLKTLGQLIVTNGQFRKLLNDATILLRDVAGDAATKSASKIAPSEDRLRQIDDPAPDHQWHEAPNFNRDQLKQQLRDKANKKSPLDQDDFRDVAGNATQAADPSGNRDPRQTAERVANERQNGHSNGGVNGGVNLQKGLSEGVNDLSQRTQENIPEDQKQRARETRERTRNYLGSKMPQERREQTIWRLKKMVVEIQSHEDYSQAIDTLLNLAETYTGHGKVVAGQSSGTVQGARQDSHLKSAETNLRVLIERFANNTSTEDFFEALNDLYRDADRDPELKNWFHSVNQYIRICLKQEGYVLQDDATREYNQLYDHGNFLLRNRYRDHTDRLVDEIKFLGDQFAADPDNQRFGESLQKLFDDLGNDENGKPAFKKHLVDDITKIILPELFESVRYVPLPRIEYSDPTIDAVVENLVLEGDNLMPNLLEIGNDSYVRFGRQSITSKRKNQVMVSASQIQADLRDVSYYVKRKQGFPSITDQGVADIHLGGEGFGFKLQLSTAEKHDRAHFFKVDNVQVTIKHMSIKLKQSNHKTLFAIFKPLLFKVIKPVIMKVLEKQIRQSFSDLDALAYRIHQAEQKIEKDIRNNPDPENVQNIYSRYYKAVQTEVLSKKKKAEDKVADKTLNVAVTKEDSHFKDINLPGGISTRATEFKDQARHGDNWQNDIFNLGSASASTGVPTPAPITRKSPHAHRRSVRDRDVPGRASRDSGVGYQGSENVGYADQNTGYGSQNTGYGNQNAGYNSQNAGYSSQNTGPQKYEGVVLNKFKDDPVNTVHQSNQDAQYGGYTSAPGVSY